jgi:glycosyltransferase involved in cell wall biosynthesis
MSLLSERITVCIFAYNEEQRLARCVRNFSGLLRILVVDNCSSDKTAAIARSLGCEVVTVKNPGYIETPEVMDRVIDVVESEYLLIASVSDFLPFNLIRKYAEVAGSRSHDVVYAYRLPITAGEAMLLAGVARQRRAGQLRFFRKGAVDYNGNQVHECGKPVCPEDRILSLVRDKTMWFYHIRNYDVSNIERAQRGYNDILAKQRFEAGTKFSFIKAIGYSVKAFLGAYVKGGVYRFGVMGFLHCYYIFHMHMGIWLRLWELQNGLTYEGVRARNEVVLQVLERQFELDSRQR